MMNTARRFLVSIAAAAMSLHCSFAAGMPLDGMWRVQGNGVDASIDLPGTMADAKLGKRYTYDDALKIDDPTAKDALVREWQYKGKATYSRDIEVPAELAGRPLELFLERVMWRSDAYVDGVRLGFRDSLATPHVYQVEPLSAGRHTLKIEVDNSCFYGFSRYAHSYGPEMQSEWHGILGRMELRVRNPLLGCRVFSACPANGRFEIDGCGVKVESVAVDGLDISGWRDAGGRITVEFKGEPTYWSEFSPKRYTLKIAGGGFSAEVPFGFRTYAKKGRTLLVNGKPTFLRGNVDNCNFALTGAPATAKDEWTRIFAVLRDEDGVNMIRFHSWCPSEAAFEAADDLGIYLMPEADMWVDRWMSKTEAEIQPIGHGLPVDGFVQAELDAIVSAYGNHPCFLSLGIGNELGDTKWEVAAKWIDDLRKKDPRRLYFVSTARAITSADDIYLSHKIDGVGPIRCRIFPHTDWDYEDVYSRAPVPTVAHEIGQWPVYPLWDELLPKFTGVLRPYNIERSFRNAQKAGAMRFTAQYHAASAKANRLMYKDETESFLRTPSCSGIEMLNVQDFTGQGEALVGWRGPFYDLKSGFRDDPPFCTVWNATNHLARFAKYQWTMDETFRATMQIRNLSQNAIAAGTEYDIVCAGRKFRLRLPSDILPGALGTVGEVAVPVATLEPNRKYTLSFGSNSWCFWTYPVEEPAPPPRGIVMTADPAAMKKALGAGRTVLYVGTGAKTGTDTFRPVYWSTVHFKTKSPLDATLGTWFDVSHPAFGGFTTEFWADWQWYDLVNGAKIHSLEGAPMELRPVALSVNDFHFSIPSATMYEARVGKGTLFVCGYDLEGKSPAAKRLRASVFGYLGSGRAKPACEIPLEWIDRMYPSTAKSEAGLSPVVLDVRLKLSGKTFSHVVRDVTPVQGVVRFHFTGEGTAHGNFEGRDFAVPAGRDRWVEVQIMREDALDNEVEVNVSTDSGAPALDRIQIVRGDARAAKGTTLPKRDAFHLFVLAGQSNMSGRGSLTPSNRVPHERVLVMSKDGTWRDAVEPFHWEKPRACGAGLAASFARAYADAHPGVTVGLVPVAYGGSPIGRWQPGMVHYTNAVHYARLAMKDGVLKGVLWHQGESDAFRTNTLAAYLPKFTNAITRLRRELDAENVPFIAGELGPYLKDWYEERRPNMYWREMNAEIAKGVALMPCAALVSAEGLYEVKRDKIHFATPALRRFGLRYWEAYRKMEGGMQ